MNPPEQLPEQYSMYGQAYPNSVQPQINTDLLLQIFSNSELLERIEHNLRGERQIQAKDSEGNPEYRKIWVKITGARPLMNEAGIAKILQIMDSNTNQKIYGYSYYEKEEIRNIMMNFTQELIQHLAKKWRDYDIDIDDIGIIVEMITNPFWATLQKSFQGFIAENTQSQINRIEGGRSQMQPLNQERKGVLSKIFPNI